MLAKGMCQGAIKRMVQKLLEAKLGEFKHSKGKEKGYECDIDGEEDKGGDEAPRQVVELVVVKKDFVDALKSVCRDVPDNLPMFFNVPFVSCI